MYKNSKIKSIKAREILDSRGMPTIEVELKTNLGKFLASVPSGVSTGKYEAVELRDEDGRGVKKAIKNIERVIAPVLSKEDATCQKRVDDILIKLDGTKNKSRLGANAILAVSMAICRAGAAAKNLPLYKYISNLLIYEINRVPNPCFNVINGGLHARNELDFQEFMIVPQKNSFSENLKIGTEIYHQLKKNLAKKYGKLATNLGDEGGFAPPIKFPEEAVELILEAAKKLNYEIKIILDVAASRFFKNGKYKMKIGVFARDGLLRYYEKLVKNYPILGLEDPFAEDDLEGWKILSSMNLRFISPLSSKLLIIGDDLTVTNTNRIKTAYSKKACNGIIIKINQIGTVTEALEAVKLAKSFGWKIIVSHRSGETKDDFIADLAVGIGAEFIKSGAPFTKERMAKYNRLLRIAEALPHLSSRLTSQGEARQLKKN
ncbi:MAG: phosphopyruvate hydratase [bacterium]|nr:phosphopyruvate hydratase [bacterium]